MNILDQLFDPENTDIITLYGSNGDRIDFEQIALVPQGEAVYVILKPVTPMEGVDEDEGLVFAIEDMENDPHLALVTDIEIIDAVFDVYDRLCEEE